MKKIMLILLAFLLILTACKKDDISKTPETEDEPKANEIKEYKADDFYPFIKDTLFSYKGEGNEYAEQKTYFEFIEDNRAQLRVINPGTEAVKVIEKKGGEVRLLSFRGEFYNIGKVINNSDTVLEVLIKEPIKVGNSWTLNDGRKRSITGIDVEINTPFKKYSTLEVTTEGTENAKQYDYYVLNQGHVASIYKSDDFEVKTLLESIEKDKELSFVTRFFYPSQDGEQVVFIDRSIGFKTNGSIEKIFEDNLKEPPSKEIRPVISQNTKVRSIIFDENGGIVKVDFSNELVSEMNAGSFMESQIIKSIVNTFGSNYNVDKVYLSLEGKPYSSGHIMINEGEYFTVDYENVVEYK